MANPWDELATRIQGNIETDEVNIYPALAEGIQTPAIVLASDDPWIESDRFGYDVEHYLAICLAEASAPQDALDRIHVMVHAIRGSSGDGWEINAASGVRSVSIPDDGTKYLGSWVRVSYRDCEHEIEEGS